MLGDLVHGDCQVRNNVSMTFKVLFNPYEQISPYWIYRLWDHTLCRTLLQAIQVVDP